MEALNGGGKKLKWRDVVKIIVRTFGLPREVLESDWFEIELPEKASVTDLTQRLNSEFPQLFGLRSLAMFINGENVSKDFKLHDGDQAFFAPVVGGG